MNHVPSAPFPKERSHTYYFLQHAKEFSPVYLTAEVNMRKVMLARKRILDEFQKKISYIGFLIETASKVIRQYPEANSAVQHGKTPKIALYDQIDAKFTMDKTINDQRAVVAGLVPNSDLCSIFEIQERIDYYRSKSFAEIEEFAPIRKLHSLPLRWGQWFYNRALSNLAKRQQLQGTFCVTSLGHKPILSVYPIISATICFGMGMIQERPAVVEGEIRIEPVMQLSMAFDHRAIDGAMAADLLSDVKTALETYTFDEKEREKWPDVRKKTNTIVL
jgi:pyruvate/2-oxoglutarate dehydrogenase complex dihydrolipoamide acyltransferase (E2) component